MAYLYNMKKIVRITENDIVNIVEKVLLENRRFEVNQNRPYKFKVGGKVYKVDFFDRTSDGNSEEKDIKQVSFKINGKGENVFGLETGKQVYGQIMYPEKYQKIIGIKDPLHYDLLVDQISELLYLHLNGKGNVELPKLNT